jgi:hypothetical protein
MSRCIQLFRYAGYQGRFLFEVRMQTSVGLKRTRRADMCLMDVAGIPVH